jgi:hypothetical protein
MHRAALGLLAACSHPAAPVTSPAAVATPPVASATSPVVAPPSKACASAEHRQLDFWIGDWDVTVHAKAAPGPRAWGEAKGRQHVESILGGCAIAESFTADGPGPAWAGKSYSSWQAPLGKWRQTWVDDSGSYLAFTGGLEAGAVTLYGEPRDKDGATIQMRMVFQDVRPDSLHWEWQRTVDGWKTVEPMMKIDYVRRR